MELCFLFKLFKNILSWSLLPLVSLSLSLSLYKYIYIYTDTHTHRHTHTHTHTHTRTHTHTHNIYIYIYIYIYLHTDIIYIYIFCVIWDGTTPQMPTLFTQLTLKHCFVILKQFYCKFTVISWLNDCYIYKCLDKFLFYIFVLRHTKYIYVYIYIYIYIYVYIYI